MSRFPTGLSAPDLHTLITAVSRCVRCGACRAVCPSFLDSRKESHSPRGRTALMKAVLDGRLSVSRIFEDRLETCTGCMACETVCASKVPVTEIIQAGKEGAVQALGSGFVKAFLTKLLRNEGVLRLTAWLAPLALHYSAGSVAGGVKGAGAGSGVRSSMITGSERKGTGGTLLFFPGCAITCFQPEIGASAVEAMKKIGYDVVVAQGAQCCGRPFLSLGDRSAARDVARRNITLFAALRPEAVVTACASCALTFKREYPKLRPGSTIPRFVDIHELLAHSLSGAPRQPVKRTITWHDPCHLSRGQGLATTARELLRGIPGIELVEMANADRCCGFGGMMRLSHPGLSDRIAGEKIKTIAATGASTVVTGCPACRMQIAEGLRRAGKDIEVLHTVQLMSEMLREAE